MIRERKPGRFKVEIYDGRLASRKRYVGTFNTREEAELAEAVARGVGVARFSGWPDAWARKLPVDWTAEMSPVARLVMFAAKELDEINPARIAAMCRITEAETERHLLWLAQQGHIRVDGRRPGDYRDPIPDELRQEIYERDEFTCLHCGTGENLSIDHIHPVVLGGTNDRENLQTLCRPCNSRKGDRA